MDQLEKITKYENGVGISFKVNKDLGLHNNLEAAKDFFSYYNVVKYLPDVFKSSVEFAVTGSSYGGAVAFSKFVKYGDFTINSLGNLKSSWGNSEELLYKTKYDQSKSMIFGIVDKVTGKFSQTGVVLVSKGIIDVYIDTSCKDTFMKALHDNENLYMGD